MLKIRLQLTKFILSAAICIAWPFLAFAQPLTAPEREALTGITDTYTAAIEAGDAEGMVGLLPNKLMDFLADREGVDPVEIRAGFTEAVELSLEQFAFKNVEFDLDAVDLLENDALKYGFAPLKFDAVGGDEVLHIQTHALALFDKETQHWHIVRIESGNAALFQAAYPSLSNLELPN